MSFLEGNSAVLERLVTEMYARGLSTPNVEDAFRHAIGDLLISKTGRLRDHRTALGGLSGLHHKGLVGDLRRVPVLRRHLRILAPQGAKEALLVAWCIDTYGRKHLLHLAVGNKESEAAWSEFRRDMVRRGLRWV